MGKQILLIAVILQLASFFIDPAVGQINYFGVAFSPYVKNGPPFPNWDTYSLDEIKQMLRVILRYHNSVSTYGMGVAGNHENL
jgi:hypothetical protein